MRHIYLLGILGIILTGALAAQAEPLPFPDGRYVTDASLCQMSEDQMLQRHGDMLGAMVRNIKGRDLSDSYEMFCTIGNVRIEGDDVRFRAKCAGEGNSYEVNGRYTRISDTSFRLGDETFSLCGSGVAAAHTPTVLSNASNSSADWYGDEYQRCEGTTVDTIQCVNGLRDEWDARLNAAYRQVMESEGKLQKSALRDAQRKWIAYRDANCAYYAGGQGSISRIEAAVCDYALTRDRARELEMMLGQ